MNRSIILLVPLAAAAAIAAAMFVAGCGSFVETIVSVSGRELTVRNPWTLVQQTHVVAEDAAIVKDGQSATLEDLEPGDTVLLMTDKADFGATIATEIVASSQHGPRLQELKQARHSVDEPSRQGTAPGATVGAKVPENTAFVPPIEFEGFVLEPLSGPFSIKSVDGKTYTFIVSVEADLIRNGQKVELDELQPGDFVHVDAALDTGRLVARGIRANSLSATNGEPVNAK